MTDGPRHLVEAVRFYAGPSSASISDVEEELAIRLPMDPNDVVRRVFHSTLSSWDWEAMALWCQGTPANSQARRLLIYDRLAIGARLRSILDEHLPHYEGPKSILIEDGGGSG